MHMLMLIVHCIYGVQGIEYVLSKESTGEVVVVVVGGVVVVVVVSSK